jgi:hypothetical protein
MAQLIGTSIFVEIDEPIEKYFSTTVSIFLFAYYRKKVFDLAATSSPVWNLDKL